MSYFKECPYCDAALDPGEKCDCQQARKESVGHAKPKPIAKRPDARQAQMMMEGSKRYAANG